MASRRKDLEIIYNLQWNHKPGKMDKTNIIGMYDIPATTMTWDLFKSYLLKNSGTTGEDVHVSYFDDCGTETKIENQDDFHVAMYLFRAKARNGEVITLKLDRISDQSSPNMAGTDVETQFESMQPHCCRDSDTPPQWFLEYMTEFQKAMVVKLDDVIADSAAALAATVSELNLKHCHNHCKCHVLFESPQEVKDSYKRKLKDVAEGTEKKDIPSKLTSKLEKLDRKYLKKRASRERKIEKYIIKECQPQGDTMRKQPEPPQPTAPAVVAAKKQPISVLSQMIKPLPPRKEKEPEKLTDVLKPTVERKLMDGVPVKMQETVPHLVGGETYFHTWLVKNTGNVPWTSKTTVEFTWGSKALKPVEKVISVPYLQPGDTGTVVAGLHIPVKPGKYESYWHFMHKGRRFGYWLGCEVIVDPLDVQYFQNLENSKVRNLDVFRALESAPYGHGVQDPLANATADLTKYKVLGQGLFGDIKVPIDNISKEKPDEREHDQLVDDMIKLTGLKLEDDVKVPVGTTSALAQDNEESESLDSDDSTSTKSSKDDFFVVEQSECAPNATNKEDATCDKVVTTQIVEQTTTSAVPKAEAPESNGNDLHDMVYVDAPIESGPGDSQQLPKPKETTPDTKDNIILRGFLDGSGSPYANSNPFNNSESGAPQNDPYLSDSNMYQSHCSAAGSSFSDVNPYVVLNTEPQQPEEDNTYRNAARQNAEPESMNATRLFVFPQSRPGFEVMRPLSDTWPNATQAPTQQPISGASTGSDTTTDSARPATNGASAAHAPPSAPQVHILPENIVSGAVSVASSAINTARSVINMIAPPEPGKWVDGHWVSTQTKSVREKNLDRLAEMGFPHRDLNASLLARYNDDLMQVIAELL